MESTVFCGHTKDNGSGEIMPPHSLNTRVGDAGSTGSKKTCWQDHLVVIEQQAAIKTRFAAPPIAQP